jgi:hypothetical protein
VGATGEAFQIGVLVLTMSLVVMACLVVWRDDHKWRDRARL